MTMLIRPAESRDVSDVARLLLQVHALHAEGRPDLFRAGERKYTDEEVCAIFADPATPVFVAELDGVVRGYAFCVLEQPEAFSSRISRKSLYIDDLCVDADARGNGIGSALYAHVVQFARDNACDCITLNVWELNTGARAFYEKLGLVPLKTVMEQKL